ncbi:MAG: hypothetical protein PHS45_04650 [Bacilli bacterium]|nr:hypothetical protein [Bacilli bacterium]
MESKERQLMPVNNGGIDEMAIYEIAEKIKDMLKSKSKIIY